MTGVKATITGATVWHGQEVGEGMSTHTGTESVGSIKHNSGVRGFSGYYLLPLISYINQLYEASHTSEESGYETYDQQYQGRPQDWVRHKIMMIGSRTASRPKGSGPWQSQPPRHLPGPRS